MKTRSELELAKRRVRQYTSVTQRDEAIVTATAERMVQHKECVWHAFAQVTQKPCWCADCRPDVKRFG